MGLYSLSEVLAKVLRQCLARQNLATNRNVYVKRAFLSQFLQPAGAPSGDLQVPHNVAGFLHHSEL